MDLLNEIVKLLSSPTWSGIGVLVSSLLSIIALVLARKSQSKPNHSQQKLVSSTATLSFHDLGTTSLPRRKNRRRSGYDPTGGVPDTFLPPSYWND
jgi:hypothetical protein